MLSGCASAPECSPITTHEITTEYQDRYVGFDGWVVEPVDIVELPEGLERRPVKEVITACGRAYKGQVTRTIACNSKLAEIKDKSGQLADDDDG